MALGGARAGAGRPKAPHTVATEKARELLINMVLKEQPAIIQAMIDKAKTGDVPAAKELLDRAYGKPTQATDITSGGESIAPVLVNYADLHANNIAKRI